VEATVSAFTQAVVDVVERILGQRLPDYREEFVMWVSSVSPLEVTDGGPAVPARRHSSYTPVTGSEVHVCRINGVLYIEDEVV
jgi:hypothetical protein